MNILIASIFSIDSYSRGIMPDVLQEQIANNPDANIYYLTCSNTFDVCYFNISKQPDICFRCKAGVSNTLSLIEGDFHSIKLSDLIINHDRELAQEFFQKNNKIDFDLNYENFEIGSSTLSTYISRSRDRDLLHVNQDYVHELASNALVTFLSVKRFIADKEIDLVYNFNGRQDYVRAILRAALANNIDCLNVERARLGGFVETYKNVLPHNIHNKWELVQECWDKSQLSQEEKLKIGSEFFERQKSGESIIFPSYTGEMKKGSLPKMIFNGNKNIVLFNSSDDEFAALGKEFDNPYYKDQLEALQVLTDFVGRSLSSHNLIIRMHPNLKGVTHEYATKILGLNKLYPNIFVISPESPADSYELIGIADKVISFGSTTGLEANYQGKPVILLGKGLYFYSIVAYVPKNISEIRVLLKKDLQPKPKDDTIKFGFYFLKGGKKTKYYFEDSSGEGIFFKKVRIHYYTFAQRFKSKLIQIAYKLFQLRIKL
ncbi:hypothetical protein [Gillisia sp. CAL575]|uniref:capsular polysaccharide export protein, LipB/KpsS family n=1 Tax=Gillisia sp. CAL575 TaxID=985255 RepID=UPI00039BCECF|nr:hypothetical protein [Gillisia sp. CAL575]